MSDPREALARQIAALDVLTPDDYNAGFRHGLERALELLAARQDEPSPALRSIVSTWFEEGYEAGNLSADVLVERIAALAANPPQTREADPYGGKNFDGREFPTEMP